MHRKTFIKNCGFACIGTLSMGSLLTGCTASKTINGKITGDDLIISLADFTTGSGAQAKFRKYLVVQHEILQYPVCVYRLSASEYAAVWMRCTHQGTELQVFGDKLLCPAHGSAFSNKGDVQNGPAGSQLRTFPVVIENSQLKISLKAV